MGLWPPDCVRLTIIAPIAPPRTLLTTSSNSASPSPVRYWHISIPMERARQIKTLRLHPSRARIAPSGINSHTAFCLDQLCVVKIGRICELTVQSIFYCIAVYGFFQFGGFVCRRLDDGNHENYGNQGKKDEKSDFFHNYALLHTSRIIVICRGQCRIVLSISSPRASIRCR